jgi:hypothetical protein
MIFVFNLNLIDRISIKSKYTLSRRLQSARPGVRPDAREWHLRYRTIIVLSNPPNGPEWRPGMMVGWGRALAGRGSGSWLPVGLGGSVRVTPQVGVRLRAPGACADSQPGGPSLRPLSGARHLPASRAVLVTLNRRCFGTARALHRLVVTVTARGRISGGSY